MFRMVSLEAMARKNVETALASTRGERLSVTSSNDVKSEAFCGEIILKLGESEQIMSDRSFEAQAVYTFVRTGFVRGEGTSKMMRDERFGKLRTVLCINVVHILMSDLLSRMGSMNRPRSKGKYDASAVRKGIFSRGLKPMSGLTQLDNKASRFTRLAMWR